MCAGIDPVSAAGALLEGGARLLQFRHKTHYTRDVFEKARCIARLCRDAGAALIIDDRADIALLLDAGVHVGQDDLPPADARRIVGPARLLGFSTHNPAQFAAGLSEPVDYVAIGPIFATSSKANPDPVVGLDGLRNLLKPGDRRNVLPFPRNEETFRLSPGFAGSRPLVAIGGITRANARAALAAGADSVAVIHDILPETCTFASLRARMEEWLQLVKM